MPYRAVLFALLVTIARLLVPGLASPDVAAADICGNQIGPTESGLSCGVEARVTDSLAGEVFGGGADPNGAGTADPGLPDAPGAPTCPGDGCFVSGTLVVTAQGMVPIEDIEVGDRVATACEGETQSSETEVDPATWRKVTLRIADVDGGVLEITALRPARWLAETGCVAGQQVWLEFPEMGAKGWALIDAVEACPPLGKGPGRVVLTTFSQLSNAIVRIWLDGPHEVVDATEGHPFWSVTRGEWRHAYLLVPGETLKTRFGSATVLRVEELPGVFRIYNLEVEAEHAYLVWELGIAVHNGGGMRARGAAKLKSLGLEGVDLANKSFSAGRKSLEEAGFVYKGRTNTGRHVFEHPKNGTEVLFDGDGAALNAGQKPHWHIQGKGGERFTQGGRPCGRNENAGHIPGG